ncbi:PREDICTED: vacuolar-sorting protein SNF8-like [Amphimedon queenslandica]|uniref:Vacuolar-sorting protein SNF8 n=1 Tax=Amphimedon queenslandica TaxID=400682 RepID=A0A1X7VQK8_AMPQE|nr:PREDICTED: vacuolar-sorting protein SNF8-like [Amphimedon queenslandica]|eukprot:XP_003383211.1 PREDICTED: vacuolar-sorting protein SNF8-like [Amphimedon queenslandica]
MASRRRGIGAIDKSRIDKAKFAAKGTEIADLQLSHIAGQLETFKKHLEEFASKHKNEIRKNPEFRNHFQQMCARIGVDPLASSKGFWAQTLGVGDFYYELGVQIIEICLATRERNGGLMTFEELKKHVTKSGSKTRQDVSEEDLARAIKKLRVLGGGFTVIPVGGRRLVQSVPGELNMDHTAVLQKAESTAFISKSVLINELKWSEVRAQSVLDHLVREGMAWIDDQASDGERLYWFPGLFETRG